MCSVCDNLEARLTAGIVGDSIGPVAQLVEHLHGMEGVARSSRVGSTLSEFSPWALGGFVAGEGWFTVARASTEPRVDGSVRLRFTFGITVASRDQAILDAVRESLGFGSMRRIPARRPGHQDESALIVSSRHAHFASTIPFMDRYLLPCAKRRQFEAWRDALVEHELAHPSRFGKGPSPCSEPGCDKPVRGRGLCRSHYYRATGY